MCAEEGGAMSNVFSVSRQEVEMALLQHDTSLRTDVTTIQPRNRGRGVSNPARPDVVPHTLL